MLKPNGYITMREAMTKYNLGSQNTFYKSVAKNNVRVREVLSRKYYCEDDIKELDLPNNYRSMREIKKILEIKSNNTFYKLAKNGKIPYKIHCGLKFYNVDEFRHYLDEVLDG